MGMFKDLRDLHKASKQFERPTMREALKQSNEAVQAYQAGMAQAGHVAQVGVMGTATVKQLRATGRTFNEWPEMEIDLTVDVNGFTSDVTHTEAVSPAILPRLVPGGTITVKVDPQDHSKLIFI
ncbi:MAG: hypothetical protein ACHQCI_03500 [Solirubrobacterales bacterium]|jgi:hypothetical protein